MKVTRIRYSVFESLGSMKVTRIRYSVFESLGSMKVTRIRYSMYESSRNFSQVIVKQKEIFNLRRICAMMHRVTALCGLTVQSYCSVSAQRCQSLLLLEWWAVSIVTATWVVSGVNRYCSVSGERWAVSIVTAPWLVSGVNRYCSVSGKRCLSLLLPEWRAVSIVIAPWVVMSNC